MTSNVFSDTSETEETVEISAETAETALEELRTTISRSNPPDEHGDPMTPLARLRERIEEKGPEFGLLGINEVLLMIDAVGRETGAETQSIDPHTDATFRAKNELQQELEKNQ